MSQISQHQTGPQVGIHASQAWYVNLKVKKGAGDGIDGNWWMMGLVRRHPWPHLNRCIDLLHLGQEVGDAFPLTAAGAVRAAEI